MILAAAGCAVMVFARAIQQQNVIGGHYIAAAVTSYLIALTEVIVVISVIDHGLAAVPWLGTGGAIGVTSAMTVHRSFFRKRKN